MMAQRVFVFVNAACWGKTETRWITVLWTSLSSYTIHSGNITHVLTHTHLQLYIVYLVVHIGLLCLDELRVYCFSGLLLPLLSNEKTTVLSCLSVQLRAHGCVFVCAHGSRCQSQHLWYPAIRRKCVIFQLHKLDLNLPDIQQAKTSSPPHFVNEDTGQQQRAVLTSSLTAEWWVNLYNVGVLLLFTPVSWFVTAEVLL